MFAFLLIVCTPVHYGVQCLAPQRYKDLATCRAVGDTYRRAATTANQTYDMSTNSMSARCVKVAQ
jgi:hypothetical protein